MSAHGPNGGIVPARPFGPGLAEAVCPHDPTDGFAAERVIGAWIGFYNTVGPHSALAGSRPAQAYGAGQPVDMMDRPDGLPTFPPAQQQHKDVINRVLAA